MRLILCTSDAASDVSSCFRNNLCSGAHRRSCSVSPSVVACLAVGTVISFLGVEFIKLIQRLDVVATWATETGFAVFPNKRSAWSPAQLSDYSSLRHVYHHAEPVIDFYCRLP